MLCEADISILVPLESNTALLIGVTVNISEPLAEVEYEVESTYVLLSVLLSAEGVAEAKTAVPPLTAKVKSELESCVVPLASAVTPSLKTRVILVLFELTDVEVNFGGVLAR